MKNATTMDRTTTMTTGTANQSQWRPNHLPSPPSGLRMHLFPRFLRARAVPPSYHRGVTRIAIARAVAVVATLMLADAFPIAAQMPRQIRVDVQFRQTGTQSRDAAGASGGVVITERGGVRPRGAAGAGATETRVQRSTGIFTLVQDGGESTLTVTQQVPYAQVAFYRDYATGAGYVASGVAFRDVGTALRVRASVLADDRIRVRLTPTISYVATDGSGTIEFTEATTDVIVPNGRAVVLAGSTTDTHVVTRQILGISREQSSSETTVVLIATAR
jgi:Bacterial type II and III secretion system protein